LLLENEATPQKRRRNRRQTGLKRPKIFPISKNPAIKLTSSKLSSSLCQREKLCKILDSTN
ncbi:MAG TPA: hypothetical protein VGB45_01995, partial [Abditibacterium sp.]